MPITDGPGGGGSVEAVDVGSPRLLALAVGAIVLSLLLLVLVPLIVERRMDGIQLHVIDVANSAHLEANSIALSLAREMALLRGYSVSRDSSFLREYREWRSREEEANRRMAALLPLLPPDLRRQFLDVSALAAGWHQKADAELAAGLDGSAHDVPSDQIFARAEFQALLQEEAELRESLDAMKSRAFQNMRRAESVGLIASIGLASLALLSTALVVWLGLRVGSYAAQVQRKHLEVLSANEARVRMMRGFSHDIKNPLAAVLLSAELLDTGIHGQLTPVQKDAVDRIFRSGTQVRELLEDLLDLSHAETGLLQVESEIVELRALVQNVVDDYSDRLAATGLSIHFDPHADAPPVVADPRRLRQILGNLIGNALKYTPSGGTITIRYFEAAEGAPAGRGMIGVEVEDNGPGIPADQLEHVFEEFVRLPGAQRQSGSGIGLAISRHLARLMNGDITLRSEPGGGSAFTLWLPISGAG